MEALNILVIEDDPIDLSIIKTRLKHIYGDRARIQVASNYLDASSRLRDPFDVCLMDYQLDFMTAFELLKRLSPEDLPGPVILITGEDPVEIESEGVNYGVFEFLNKSEITESLLRRAITYCRARHQDLRRIAAMAHHDQLTNLLNRHTFFERFQRLLDDKFVDADQTYLLYLDADNFKAINDTYGHNVGDQVLVFISDALKQNLRNTDIVARLGGDEFVAVVQGVNRESLPRLAEKLMNALREPLKIGESIIRVSVSCGIVRFSQGGNCQEDLMIMADQAMYRAKGRGRDNYLIFDESMNMAGRLKAQTVQQLRSALQNDEFFLVFEPQLNIAEQKMVGAEALIRWQHPLNGVVSPSEFLPVAESSGLIVPIGRWVVSRALKTYHQWLTTKAIPENFRIAVNVSPKQLLTKDFVDLVVEELYKLDLKGECLQVEISEHAMLTESEFVNEELIRLSKLGVTIAIDDFGTGYSSITKLSEMNIDCLKLDMKYVSRVCDDKHSRCLVESFVFLAKQFNYSTIAEGVETPEQEQVLKDIGCDMAQGWLYRDVDLLAEQFVGKINGQLG
nr:EAL domain-containing protein [Litorivivens lipolytica]